MVGPEQHPALAEGRGRVGGKLGAGDEFILQAGGVRDADSGLHCRHGLSRHWRGGATLGLGGDSALGALRCLSSLLGVAIGDEAFGRGRQLAGRLISGAAGKLGFQPALGIAFGQFEFTRTGAESEPGDRDGRHLI